VKVIPELPRKVLIVVTPVLAAGVFTICWAAYRYAGEPHTARSVAELVAMTVAIALAERFPVPVAGMGAGGVTVGFVFAVSSIVLLGWPAAVLVVAIGPAVTHLIGRRPPIRVAYNGSMFALSALAAGAVIDQIHGDSAAVVVAEVLIAAFIYYWVVNLALISAVLAATSGRPYFQIVKENLAQTTAPFALMTSAALILCILWQRSPLLSLALAGPLLAIGLYQRSTFREMEAMRLALTDPLTGLGNHRSFHERLQRELDAAEQAGAPVALCLFDLDDLKKINDGHGHPMGDAVLGQVASRLRQGGEAFRLGGDEFAVLLPGVDEREASAIARSIVERIAALRIEGIDEVTVSSGVATFPTHGAGRD